MSIGFLQINTTVGALQKNADMILSGYKTSAESADIIVTPELALTGYPPEDLLLRPAFAAAVMHRIDALAHATDDRALLFGAPEYTDGGIYNAAFLARNGRVERIFRKRVLPNYGVFDEHRYFTRGAAQQTITVNSNTYAVLLCEDMWDMSAQDPAPSHVDAVITLNASPFEKGKTAKREAAAAAAAAFYRAPVFYVNTVGGQDELVFDGASFVTDANGTVTARFPAFEEHSDMAEHTHVPPHADTAMYQAIRLGLRDYVLKSGFTRVMLGLSGGADSAFVAALAVDALGADAVDVFYLPSPFSSDTSRNDAYACAANLRLTCHDIPISGMMHAAHEAIAPHINGDVEGLTAENIQPRLRAMALMAISNAAGAMLLTTGNKSEVAVGYCTLYGDMCGGFNPVKDLYKTELYALCRYVNAHIIPDAIPDSILTKAPTAELRADQKDSDSLPDYPVLDPILMCLLEERLSVDDTAARGFNRDDVAHVLKLITRSEYKRRQAAPGTKISGLSFGKERRYPIVQAFL